MIRNYILPAGDYLISDPCYPFPNTGEKSTKWNAVLKETDYFNKPCDLPNIKIWAASTAYGDGIYFDTNRLHEFGVDSGTLGIMTKETVNYLGEDPNYVSTCGIFVTFDKEFNVIFSDGYFKFGHIEINTNDQESDEEYCWDEYEEESDEEDEDCCDK